MEARAFIVLAQVEYQEHGGVVDIATVEDGIRVAREANDPNATAFMLNFLGFAPVRAEDVPGAVGFLEEARAVARRHGIKVIEATATQNLGWFRYLVGDLEGGRTRSEESLAMKRASEVTGHEIASVVHSLAEIERASGNFAA